MLPQYTNRLAPHYIRTSRAESSPPFHEQSPLPPRNAIRRRPEKAASRIDTRLQLGLSHADIAPVSHTARQPALHLATAQSHKAPGCPDPLLLYVPARTSQSSQALRRSAPGATGQHRLRRLTVTLLAIGHRLLKRPVETIPVGGIIRTACQERQAENTCSSKMPHSASLPFNGQCFAHP